MEGFVRGLLRVVSAMLTVLIGAAVLVTAAGLAVSPSQTNGPLAAVALVVGSCMVGLAVWAFRQGLLAPWLEAFRSDSGLRARTGMTLALGFLDVFVLARYGAHMLSIAGDAFHSFAIWAVQAIVAVWLTWFACATFVALFTFTAVYPRTRVIVNRAGAPVLALLVRFGLPVLVFGIAVWGVLLLAADIARALSG